jgi:predicted amidohydrolase
MGDPTVSGAFNSHSDLQKVKVAAVQLNSQTDPVANRAHATALIREAAAHGAQFIVTPEYTNTMVHDEKDALDLIQPDDDTNTDLQHYRALAKELGVWLSLGSIAVSTAPGKMANRNFTINPQGEIVGRYDKTHLFDVDLPPPPGKTQGDSYRESDIVDFGDHAQVTATPFGNVGSAICYDLRFPALFQTLALDEGATILTVPAAYTVPSGERTWETFLRARAAETGSYVIAPGQCGTYQNGTAKSWGHSMIVSPWGTILSQAADPDKPGIVYADLDPAEIDAARTSYPVDKQRRKFDAGGQTVKGSAAP